MIPPAGLDLADRIHRLGERIDELSAEQQSLAGAVAGQASAGQEAQQSMLGLFQSYIGVLVVAFLITLLITPIIRRAAIANGIVDRPDARKMHRMPVAYLGGVSVFAGIMAGIMLSYFAPAFPLLMDFHATQYISEQSGTPYLVPLWIPLGLTVIMVVGLLDDVTGVTPRVKLGGQLFAAAALAYGDFGVNVAAGVLKPTLGRLLDNEDLIFHIATLPDGVPLLSGSINFDLIYWTGTAVIAVFVLGACNASNLIDGLDGLLTGVTSIAAVGWLLVALSLALVDDGARDSQRIVLCMAVLGACLGFLPHNFNPATIFLGDCGSLLLGFCSAVIILSFGNEGRTDLVIAGLIIYAIPIIDTILAIFRRKLAGKKMSEADSDHLHHMLKRAAGVKGAVLILYGMGIAFAILGIAMTSVRARSVYALALLFAAYIIVFSIKIARRAQLEAQTARPDATRHLRSTPTPTPEPEPDQARGTAETTA